MALNAPVATAARDEGPKGATKYASVRPMTVWLIRERTTGHAKPRSVLSETGASDPPLIEPS
jgi:hypothetical protein